MEFWPMSWFAVSPLGPLTHLMVISLECEYIIVMALLGVVFTLGLWGNSYCS